MEDETLEHALLESLFYNEMAMMDEWSDSMLATNGAVAPAAAAATEQDPAVATEKEILQDFGVVQTNTTTPPTAVASPNPSVLEPIAPVSAVTTESNNPSKVRSAEVPPPVGSFVPAVTAAAMPLSGQPKPKSRGIKHSVTGPPAQAAAVAAPKDRQKLVGQFESLAERLGITIPSEIMNRLNTTPTSPTMAASPTTAVTVVAPPAATASTTAPKRSLPPSSTTAAAPAPAKRRKKPRLHECERRLSELQAENERLKRHLDLIANKSHKAQVERVEAETKMRKMLQSGAPDEEIQPLLHSFQEMYSDYGKKRFEELEFHLEQLQSLAKPADFTKMGLWTLGGQSNNQRHSISSLLLAELSITPPQSRKIMEQREKIRTVCDNLKESLALLGKLRSLCELKTKIFNDRMSKVRELLTPQQVVKLILWINENSSTLQTVCPGWQSEQFQQKDPQQKQQAKKEE